MAKTPIGIENYTDFTLNKRFMDRWVRTYERRAFWLKTIRYHFPDLEALIQTVFSGKVALIKITSNDATIKIFPKDDLNQSSVIDVLILRGDVGKMYLIRDILKLTVEADFDKFAKYIQKEYPQVEVIKS